MDLKREQWKCDACSKIKYTEMVMCDGCEAWFHWYEENLVAVHVYTSLYYIVAEVFVFMFIGLV